MMHSNDSRCKYHYYENDDVKILGIPYEGAEAFMFIVLPKEKFGLAKVLENLTGKSLLEFVQKSYEMRVKVSILILRLSF